MGLLKKIQSENLDDMGSEESNDVPDLPPESGHLVANPSISTSFQEVQFEKDRKSVSAIESRAEQRQAADETKERMALEGAKQLVEATSMALSASYSDDHQVRSAEIEQARRLETDAYKKLAAVDAAQANVLVSVERDNVGNDGQLKASIRLDEAKLAAAARELNAEADKAMAVADVGNFKEIQNPALQEQAAVQIIDNIRNYPDYKTALETAEPGITKKVAALNAANTTKVDAKEDRKVAEYATLIQDPEDKAKAWAPEEAARARDLAQVANHQIQPQTENSYGQSSAMSGDLLTKVLNTPFALTAAAGSLVVNSLKAMGDKTKSFYVKGRVNGHEILATQLDHKTSEIESLTKSLREQGMTDLINDIRATGCPQNEIFDGMCPGGAHQEFNDRFNALMQNPEFAGNYAKLHRAIDEFGYSATRYAQSGVELNLDYTDAIDRNLEKISASTNGFVFSKDGVIKHLQELAMQISERISNLLNNLMGRLVPQN